MSVADYFPETSITLLGKLAAQNTGEDQANWLRFWNLYAGAIRRFAVRIGDENHADDIVAEVMRKLVEVFRGGTFERRRGGNFRAYLAQMVRNELGMAYRREKARRMDRRVYLDDNRPREKGGDEIQRLRAEDEMSVGPDGIWEALDLEWAAARRQELVAHLLANPAVKPLYRDVFREIDSGVEVDAIVERHGISRNLVSQIKLRMEKALNALAAELGDV